MHTTEYVTKRVTIIDLGNEHQDVQAWFIELYGGDEDALHWIESDAEAAEYEENEHVIEFLQRIAREFAGVKDLLGTI